MVCSDINDENIEWANKNIKNNNLDCRISSKFLIILKHFDAIIISINKT
jgi:hypothetical protein